MLASEYLLFRFLVFIKELIERCLPGVNYVDQKTHTHEKPNFFLCTSLIELY